MKQQNKLLLTSLLTLSALDQRLKTVTYRLSSPKIKNPFKIVFIADLHGCYYGENQSTLVKAIKKANPHLILLGGDIFDDIIPYDNTEILLAEIAALFPCYYVTGNHEYRGHNIQEILKIVDSFGVTTLNGTCDVLEIEGNLIQICGIADPSATHYVQNQDSVQKQLKHLETLLQPEFYSILLTHRPELIQEYLYSPYDLSLAGHAHGGQWRIPFLCNGVFSPNQGLFPKFAGGHYPFEEMDFIVSRGLARETTIVPRIWNRPELVVIEIS
ncbi:MAG: metallophosphoesterase [Eubacteriales bacterium]